jgi:hypothetical protein
MILKCNEGRFQGCISYHNQQTVKKYKSLKVPNLQVHLCAYQVEQFYYSWFIDGSYFADADRKNKIGIIALIRDNDSKCRKCV